MSHKYKNLRQPILTLHHLHKNWSSSDIADKLQNSGCPPSQTRHALVRYINYTIKRGTIDPRARSGRPKATRTTKFISLVKLNSYKKDIHQLWHHLFTETPVVNTKLIIGNRNNTNHKGTLVHRRPHRHDHQ